MHIILQYILHDCIAYECVFLVAELPYPPTITSVRLSVEEARAVDVQWRNDSDGNSPITKYSIAFRQITPGE